MIFSYLTHWIKTFELKHLEQNWQTLPFRNAASKLLTFIVRDHLEPRKGMCISTLCHSPNKRCASWDTLFANQERSPAPIDRACSASSSGASMWTLVSQAKVAPACCSLTVALSSLLACQHYTSSSLTDNPILLYLIVTGSFLFSDLSYSLLLGKLIWIHSSLIESHNIFLQRTQLCSFMRLQFSSAPRVALLVGGGPEMAGLLCRPNQVNFLVEWQKEMVEGMEGAKGLMRPQSLLVYGQFNSSQIGPSTMPLWPQLPRESAPQCISYWGKGNKWVIPSQSHCVDQGVSIKTEIPTWDDVLRYM